MKHHNTSEGFLVPVNGFTKGVFEFAQGKPITLIDITGFILMQKVLDAE